MIEVIGGLLLMALMGSRTNHQEDMREAMGAMLGLGYPEARVHVLFVLDPKEKSLEDRLMDDFLSWEKENASFTVRGTVLANHQVGRHFQFTAVTVSIHLTPAFLQSLGSKSVRDYFSAALEDPMMFTNRGSEMLEGDFVVLGWSGFAGPDEEPGLGEQGTSAKLLGLIGDPNDFDLVGLVPGDYLQTWALEDPTLLALLRERWDQAVKETP